LQPRLAQLNHGSGVPVLQQLLDGIDGIIDAARPSSGFTVMDEIAISHGSFECPSSGRSASLGPRAASRIEDKPFEKSPANHSK
jgi:hypothetical protein